MQQQELVILHVILGTILMEQHVNHVQERQTVIHVQQQQTNVQHVNLDFIQVEQVVLHVVPTIVQRVIHQQVHVSHVVQIDISVEHNVFSVPQQ